MGIFTQIADKLEEAQTVAIFITKTPTGELRVTITDPHSRGDGKYYMGGSPAMMDSIASSLQVFGIDAMATVVKAAVSRELSSVVPDSNKFEIREEQKNNYYKHGKKNGHVRDWKIICDKGDVLMRQREYEQAKLMYESGLLLDIPKKNMDVLKRRIERAESNIAFMKENPDGFIKNPLPPKNDHRPHHVKAGFTKKTDINPETAIGAKQVELNLDATSETVGSVVLTQTPPPPPATTTTFDELY